MERVITLVKEKYALIDKELLINKPWLWETKIHLALAIGAGLSVFSLIVSLLFRSQLVSRGFHGAQIELLIPVSIAIFCLVGFGYWVSKHIFIIGDIDNIHINKSTFRLQFAAYFFGALVLAMPVGISLLVGFFQYSSNYGNIYPYLDVKAPLIVMCSLFAVTSLIQIIKSIDAFQLVKSLSLYAMLIVIETVIWNLSVWFGVLVGIASVILIAWLLNKKEEAAESPKINATQFVIALFMQILIPVSCCSLSYVASAILTETIFPFFNLHWLAISIGLFIYSYQILPQFHLYYLRYRQMPTA